MARQAHLHKYTEIWKHENGLVLFRLLFYVFRAVIQISEFRLCIPECKASWDWKYIAVRLSTTPPTLSLHFLLNPINLPIYAKP